MNQRWHVNRNLPIISELVWTCGFWKSFCWFGGWFLNLLIYIFLITALRPGVHGSPGPTNLCSSSKPNSDFQFSPWFSNTFLFSCVPGLNSYLLCLDTDWILFPMKTQPHIKLLPSLDIFWFEISNLKFFLSLTSLMMVIKKWSLSLSSKIFSGKLNQVYSSD